MMKATAALIIGFVAVAYAAPSHAQEGSANTPADPWFATDKYLHGSISAGLAIAGYSATAFASHDVDLSLGVGAGLALGAGVAKELIDLHGPGDASWRDLTWDILGTASGLLVAWAADTYVF